MQTQVLPYLRELQKGGVEVSILTFEPNPRERWTPESIAEQKEKLAAEGIEWNHLTYHKRPSAPATVFDIINGAFFLRRKLRREKIDILHARVHVPAVMAALARKFLSQQKKPKLLFDIRGFFPEEYVDAGVWPADGLIFRAVKRIERWLMREADGFVVLTERAREILFDENNQEQTENLKPVEVIPCCVDLKRFESAGVESRTRIRKELRLAERFVCAYIGAFGGWYLTKETADFLGALKTERADAYALILTQSEPSAIRELLLERGYGASDYLIAKVAPELIPEYLSAADVAVSFIKPCYSKQASSPTKNAEYLACGLPIIANDGVGDTTEQIENDSIGVIIRDFSDDAYMRAIDQIFELLDGRDELGARCRESARQRFDLETVGGLRYRRLYKTLLERK